MNHCKKQHKSDPKSAFSVFIFSTIFYWYISCIQIVDIRYIVSINLIDILQYAALPVTCHSPAPRKPYLKQLAGCFFYFGRILHVLRNHNFSEWKTNKMFDSRDQSIKLRQITFTGLKNTEITRTFPLDLKILKLRTCPCPRAKDPWSKLSTR